MPTVVAALLILLAECCLCNLPHWRSLSTAQHHCNVADSDPTQITTGKGLVKLDSGALQIADPTQAYIEIQSQGCVNYVQVYPSSSDNEQSYSTSAAEHKYLVSKIHVRLDLQEKKESTWVQAGSTVINPSVSSSMYVKNRSTLKDAHAVRLWIGEQSKSVVQIGGLDTQPLIPFSFNWCRVAIMSLIAALLIFLRPRSRLWYVQLDTRNIGQRCLFWLSMFVIVAWAIHNAINEITGFQVMTYHDQEAYAYDFNQYGHLADALLQGRFWLDLPVPDALSDLPNPYDIHAREGLLSAGEEPIFWDHVFYNHRWYSYFGPLPAILIYAPYRAVTSLFVPGGLMLPTPAACAILTAGFTVTCSLLIIRLIRRFLPNASIAATILAILAFFTGSQMAYLYFRTDFYTVPFDAALLVASLGLWFWLGARRVHTDTSKKSIVWTTNNRMPGYKNSFANTHVYVSLPHVAAGSLLITATLGCRQTFISCAALGLPIFADEISAMIKGLLNHKTPLNTPSPAIAPQRSIAILAAVIIPAIIVVSPLLVYNFERFGSVFDFGNNYQITVVDLNTYKTPRGNIIWLIFYYLLLPLTPTSAFPYLQRSPAPLPIWQYSQPGLGGLFILAPIFALSLILLCLPKIHRKLKDNDSIPMITSLLALAVIVLLFTAYVAGLDARYMLDFSWLVGLAAIFPLVAAGTSDDILPHACVVAIRLALVATFVITLILATGTTMVEINRSMAFAQVQAWFSLL